MASGCEYLCVAYSCLHGGMKDTPPLDDALRGPLHLRPLTTREIEVMDYMIQARLCPLLPNRRLHWKALYRCSIVVADLFCMSRKTHDMQKRRIEDSGSPGISEKVCTLSATTSQSQDQLDETEPLPVFEKWTKPSQGCSTKEIAEAAGVSTGTVTSHITNIRAKLRIVRKGRPALIAAYLASRDA